ncbi:MAG TPA: CoA-transferase [Syntrophorhabdaceae bacterium]|nr:CoA-transferase [Syntrophorhabdaceae bacterium]
MDEYGEISDKLMSLDQAVRRFVRPGSQVALGGFTITRNPMAFVYEIARQGIRDLHLVCHSNGQALDVLIGAGCVKRLEIAYSGNGRYAPTCVRFKKAVELGDVEFEDYSNFQMGLRFLAGALDLPFMPVKSGLGSDLINRKGFSRKVRRESGVAPKKCALIQNPFSKDDDRVILVPALTPDLVVLHAQYVGDDGTVRIKGLTFADVEQAKAASAVVVTCEQIVPKSSIRLDPDQNTLPPFLVDAVVKAPFGAHPTGCYGFYDYDPLYLNLYKNAALDDDRYRRYLDEWVYGVGSHEQYLKKIGEKRLAEIKADPVLGYTPGLERK